MVRATHCCGIAELTRVGPLSQEEIQKQLKLAKAYRYGLVMATTANYQGKAVETKLKKLGFRCIKRFRNPNSANYVKMWIKSTENVPGKPNPRLNRPYPMPEDRAYLPEPVAGA